METLTRTAHWPRIALPGGGPALARARLHEACGPARHAFALMLAQGTEGPVFWIRPGWAPGGPNPDGVWPFIDPARLVLLAPGRAGDLLWVMEESLRAGSVPLVVAELPDPPGLTPVRRLHLAAEAGAQTGGMAPAGLVLTPGDGGAPGVESRWHMAPRHPAGGWCWQLERRRARMAPPAAWTVTQAGRRMTFTRASGGGPPEKVRTEPAR